MRVAHTLFQLCLFVVWGYVGAMAQSATGSRVLAFAAMPTMTACGTSRISWTLSAGNLTDYKVTLRVVNDNVNQSIPPPSSTAARSSAAGTSPTAVVRPTSATSISRAVAVSSPRPAASSAAVSRAATAVGIAKRAEVNKVIVLTNASTPYNWKVDIPQGRYFMYAAINDGPGTWAKSQEFTVLNGTDTTCLVASGAAGNPSPAVSSSAQPSAASAGAGSASGEQSGGGGIGGGAIAGIVIGVLALLAAAIAAWFILARRKKRQQDNAESGYPAQMQSRNRSSSLGNVIGAVVQGNNRRPHHVSHPSGSDNAHIALTSMGSTDGGHEKEEFVGSFGSEKETLAYQSGTSPGSRQDPFATAPNTPHAPHVSTFAPGIAAAFGSGPAGDRRRSTPPVESPTRTNHRGLERNHSRNRSNSQPSSGPSGKVGVTRGNSMRRKPVPSLGAELRDQMKREGATQSRKPSVDMPGANGNSGSDGSTETIRPQFQLIPDPPRSVRD